MSREGRSAKRRREGRRVFFLLLPIMVFAIAFVYLPFIRTIINAFSRVNSKGIIKGFAGLENFIYTYSRKDFLPALKHTLIIAIFNVPITLVITLTLALLSQKRRRLSAVYETMFTLPMSVSMSAACMIFKSMFSPSAGFINYFFSLKLGWFESTETALAACIILTVWMGIGFDYLLLLSALRGIPKSVMEATEVDGISLWRKIFLVEIPLISPTIFYIFCQDRCRNLCTRRKGSCGYQDRCRQTCGRISHQWTEDGRCSSDGRSGADRCPSSWPLHSRRH